MKYAGFWVRVLAYIIDTLILMVPFVVIGFVAGSSGVDEEAFKQQEWKLNIISIFVAWFYYAGMESSERQATLGKQAMQLRVTDEQGGRLSFGRATGRYFAKIISAIILGIGFIMVAFTQRKQGLHDMIASTLVIRK